MSGEKELQLLPAKQTICFVFILFLILSALTDRLYRIPNRNVCIQPE